MKAEAKAQLKSLRMAPQKVRLVVDAIRGMEVKRALRTLNASKKHAARPVKKLLESAVANAKQQNIKTDELVIETAFVDEGKSLKRWMPRAMGRATPLRKRSSHITLVIAGEVDETKATEKLAEEDKKTDEEQVEQKAEVAEPKKEAAPKKKAESKKKAPKKQTKEESTK